MVKITFEEACKISHDIMFGENMYTLGPEETSKICREALKDVGWTIGELCDESARRMKEKIRVMEDEEAKAK